MENKLHILRGNKLKDVYEKFAYDCEEFGCIEDYLGGEQAFFKQLFDENQIKTVLGCVCGTRQHLFMLSEMELCVSESDYSASVLRVASENLKKAREANSLAPV